MADRVPRDRLLHFDIGSPWAGCSPHIGCPCASSFVPRVLLESHAVERHGAVASPQSLLTGVGWPRATALSSSGISVYHLFIGPLFVHV